MTQRINSLLLNPATPADGKAERTPTFSEATGDDGYTHRGLDVCIIKGNLTAENLDLDVNLSGDPVDMDTSPGGEDKRDVVGIVVPGAGGGQVAGINETPLIVEDKAHEQHDGGEITCTVAATEYNITLAEAFSQIREVVITPDPDPLLCAGEITLILNGHDSHKIYAGDVAKIKTQDITAIGVKSDNAGDLVQWSAHGDKT